MSFAHIKGVIFDLGSTLIEFESRSWDVISYEGQKMAYEQLRDGDNRLPSFEVFNDRLEEIKGRYRERAVESLEEWRSVDAFEELLTEFGLDDAPAQSIRCVEAVYDVARNGFRLCKGALETVTEVKRRGYRTGLISNTIFPSGEHEADLENCGLLPYIDFRLYSSDFGRRKPHPAIYAEGLRRMGLPAREVLFVGDLYREDVEGPMTAGMSAVLKYREGRMYPDPLPGGFPVIHTLSELLDILKA